MTTTLPFVNDYQTKCLVPKHSFRFSLDQVSRLGLAGARTCRQAASDDLHRVPLCDRDGANTERPDDRAQRCTDSTAGDAASSDRRTKGIRCHAPDGGRGRGGRRHRRGGAELLPLGSAVRHRSILPFIDKHTK